MWKYLLKRLLEAVAVVFGVTLVTFLLLNVIPGDPVQLMLGDMADAESLARVRHQMGLDQPIMVQYLHYMNNLVHCNMGTSYFSHENVFSVLSRSFQVTLKLAGISYLFALLIGISCGVIAAVNRGKALDSALMSLAVAGISAPSFWVGIILQIVFGLMLNLLPVSGIDTPAAFVLPAISLGTRYAASLARITRTSMLEITGQDFIRTARAKGIPKVRVTLMHTLKNALIPIITLAGTELGNILSGSMLTETVFSIPGIGKLTVDSITSRDLPLLQGAVIYIATICVIVYLLVDIAYACVDPRIRLGEEGAE
jgi:peptide/nickel transport system permease protein